jgi:threonine dehydrogenase-like Zn-dependent dehydrogenase
MYTIHKKGTASMKALVYHGPGNRALEDKPKPEIQAPTDAIVKITKTTIFRSLGKERTG